MPGPNSEKEQLVKERILTSDEMDALNAAGLIVPLHEVELRIDDREEAFWLLFIRGHGLAVHSRQTDCVYLLTAYGLICLAKGKGIDKELPLIIVPPGAGEVTHGA